MGHHQKVKFPANQMIFREGESGECAYLVESGRVMIFLEKDGTEIPLRALGEGEVFGEMSLIDNSPRSASCRAISDCQLIVVTKDQLLDRITNADPIVRLLMKALLERLRSQNHKIRNGNSHIAISTDPLTPIKKEALDRINLENRIANGLDDDEFFPFYQPIYDLSTGQVVGCEALIRWNSKQDGMISPAVFMDVMEDTSLILKAGQVMIEKSLRDLPKMSSSFEAGEDFFVSINVSGRQFSQALFSEQVEKARVAAGVPPHQIKLELTERIMTEGPQAVKALEDCRTKGYKLAIDDFGTGFSSLQYLSQMPLTDLKIDRSFVMRMRESEKSLSVVSALVHLATLLGMSLTAEGIEKPEELQILKNMGVHYGQGFLFAKPMALNDFLQLGILRKKSA